MRDASLFDQIGHDRLREVMEAFYDRLFADDMIGFLFAGKDKATLVQREWEFTARLLGASLAYSGRAMPAAHRASPILVGHFDRRMQLLREVLAAFAVPPEVQAAWLAHAEAMRGVILQASDSSASQPASPQPSPPPPAQRLKILPID